MRRLKIVGKWKRSSLYKKSIILFSTFMIVLIVIFLSYVYNSMVLYERNLVDNYIVYLAKNGKLTEGINDNLFKISQYEKNNAKISDGVKKLYKSDNLKVKKNTKESSEETFAYDLYNGNKLISTVSIKSKNKYKRMAILTIDEWEIVDSKTYFEDGIYSYEITIPSDYKLFINDIEASNDDIIEEGDIKGLENVTEYAEISKSKTYKINNLVYEADIKIKDDNNKLVNYENKDNKIIVNKEFKKYATYDDLKKDLNSDFDVLGLAENWSLFLTKDRSFNSLLTYFIKDSYMYNRAYQYAHGIDITFVSNHRLKNPTFTNESVTNCIMYNENVFSCEVKLEKNMVVNGNDRVDTMHERMYFVNYNDGYKLVNMESITK